MYPATRAAKATPESSLRKWFVPALSEFQSFVYFFNSITEEDLRGFWHRRKYPAFDILHPLKMKTYRNCADGRKNRCSISINLVWKLSHLPLSAGL
jgi:transposase-like protein